MDPQLDARDMIATLEHAAIGPLKVLGTPIKLSETPGGLRTAPPLLGAHTEAVLSEDLGLTRERIKDLRAQGIV